MWTESLAVGDESFVEEVKRSLARRMAGQESSGHQEGVLEIREPAISYSTVFDLENPALSLENTYLWDVSH
jgi:hypothetical protein